MPSWTAPRTWVVAELVTAALLNTHLRDNLNSVNDVLTVPLRAWASGTPDYGTHTDSFTSVLLFATTETAGGTVVVPQGWQTAQLVLWWTNAGAGSGNVNWTVAFASTGDTESPGAGTSSSGFGAIAAPVRGVRKKTVGTAFAVTPGECLDVYVRRESSSDTLGNDASVYALELRRAS